MGFSLTKTIFIIRVPPWNTPFLRPSISKSRRLESTHGLACEKLMALGKKMMEHRHLKIPKIWWHSGGLPSQEHLASTSPWQNGCTRNEPVPILPMSRILGCIPNRNPTSIPIVGIALKASEVTWQFVHLCGYHLHIIGWSKPDTCWLNPITLHWITLHHYKMAGQIPKTPIMNMNPNHNVGYSPNAINNYYGWGWLESHSLIPS